MGRLHKLNVSKVGSLKEPDLYSDGGCLHLRVAPGGSKQWVFRYSLGHRTRDYGVGPYPTLSLAEARDRAHGLRKLLLDKIDPIEHRRQERATAGVGAAKRITFDEAAKTYIAEHERSWRRRQYHGEWVSSLRRYVTPVFGKLPVSAVNTELVMRALRPIWLEKPVAAARTRGRIEMVLDWATAMGYRVGDNPARFSGHLDHLLPDQTRGVRHHTAMPHADVPGFIRKLETLDGIAPPALVFVILTAVRVGEALGATWDEIDGRTWIVPAGRMKRNREHRVPLSDAALAIIEKQRLIRHSDYIFPGRHGVLTSNRLLELAQQCGATVHGFRSSFRDWAAERTNTPREIAELALAHSVGSTVERAYARSTLFEKRAELMEGWGRYCSGIGAVVPLRASA